LALWEVKTTRHGGVATSAIGEAAPGMGKGGDDACWADVNLTGPKNEENSRGQSSCYKWMVKIESNDGEFNFF
jgi:hypothetical protein